ncbi:hypothetical protein FACS1894104_5690 [Actinomycetota bacterium]|nr:hypothetical protein FACS1894104_5690 [Actinomycetota bacterium]
MHKDALDIDIKVFADSIRDYSDNLKRSHSLFGSNPGVGFGNGYQDFSQDISENQYTHVFMFTDTDINSGISRLISDTTNRVKQLYIFSLAGVWTKDVRGDKRAEIVKIY